MGWGSRQSKKKCLNDKRNKNVRPRSDKIRRNVRAIVLCYRKDGKIGVILVLNSRQGIPPRATSSHFEVVARRDLQRERLKAKRNFLFRISKNRFWSKRNKSKICEKGKEEGELKLCHLPLTAYLSWAQSKDRSPFISHHSPRHALCVSVLRIGSPAQHELR